MTIHSITTRSSQIFYRCWVSSPNRVPRTETSQSEAQIGPIIASYELLFSDYEESALDRVLQAAFNDEDGTGKLTFDLNDTIDYTTEDFYR